MTEAPPTRRRGKLVRDAVIGLLALLLVLGVGWYLTSAHFEEQMRRKLVSQLEQMTGGRIELGAFRWNLFRLEFEARDLTIHGLEGPGQVPYAHVDRLLLRLKILSLLSRRVGVRFLEVDHPRIHIIVYPDGRSNQPTPKTSLDVRGSAKALFDLGIDRMEVQAGQLLWNQQSMPLEFSATGVVAAMTNAGAGSYDVLLQLSSVETTYGTFRRAEGKSEIRLGLSLNRIELRSVKLISDHSSLEAHGSISNLHNPSIELGYKGSLDLAEMGALIRVPELRTGRLDISGQGLWQGSDFKCVGRMLWAGVEWRQPDLRLPQLTVGANYTATREHLLISNITGQGFGGGFFGSAEVSNWMASEASRGGPAATRQHGTVRLRLARVQLSALTAAVSSPKLPLDRINPAGAVTGTVDVEWTGSLRNADARVLADVEAPEKPGAGQMPVAAHVQMGYHGTQSTFEISHLTAVTRDLRLNADGVLGSTNAGLIISAEARGLGDIQRVLGALGKPALPVELHGEGSFKGGMTGKLSAPTVSGHLEMSDFDVTLARGPWLTVADGSAPRRTHWDSLTTDLVYSPSELAFTNGLLQRGTAQAHFDLVLGLHGGSFDNTGSLRGQLKLTGADVRDLLGLAGTDYPFTGMLSLEVTASGSRLHPAAQGKIEVLNGSLKGEPFRSLRGDLRLADREAQLTNLILVHNGAQITGEIAYDFGNTGLHFDLRGSNFQLSKFHQLQGPGITVAGLAGFRLQGTGTVAAPVINIELHVHDIVLSGEPAGDFALTGVTHGADFHLTAQSHFKTAELSAEGDVRLRGDYPANITLRFANLDIDALLRIYLRGRVTGHSSLEGALELRGPLLHPRDLNITAHVDQFSAGIEKVTLQSEGPSLFTLSNEVLRIEQLHLRGFDRTKVVPETGARPPATTDFTAAGTLQLGGAREVHIRALGTLDLALLQSFNPDITSSGLMQVDLRIGGTMSRPETAGTVRVLRGAVSYIDLPNGLSNINGTLVFNENRLKVETLTAQTGGGTLALGGFITYSNGLVFNLTATSKDIRLRYPPGVSASADADLRFTGTPKNSLLSGTVTINKFNVSPQFDLAYYFGRFAQTPTGGNPDSPLNNLHFDLHFVSAQELQVEMSVAKLSGDADLRLRGTANHPVLLGRVDIAQGNIDIAGTKYHLERGNIRFNNPTTIEPVLDIEATARIRDYDISLGLHGPMSHISVNYRSDPPLPTSDIIALLALGRTQEESLVYQTQATPQSLSDLTSNAILGNAVNAAFSSRAQRLFGASRIKIDPQAGENNPNARVTIEQQASDKVTLTFISNLAQSAQQIVQVEYNINRRLSVVAVRDQNGVLSFDVRYRQRKR